MSKKNTPKKPSPKESIFNLFRCGGVAKKVNSSDGKSAGNAIDSVAEEDKENNEDRTYVNRDIVTVKAVWGHSERKEGDREGEEEEISYTNVKLIGKGTFGKVYKAKLCNTGENVAIKKVFDDKRYKNRELHFTKRLVHPNIVDLKYYFYSVDEGCRKGERYLNMISEFIPETLYSLTKCDGTYTKPLLQPIYIKVYLYQLLRSLNYIHSMNICHRDIKPQNLLIDPSTNVVKLCDFGSAKELLMNESNLAYICSRYYRAPELIFGSKTYNCQIDVWSAGCVMAELYQGHPLFPGATGPDQMVEIMKILGTPTYEDIMDINHNCRDMRFPPQMIPMSWNKVFTKNLPKPEGLDLISRLLAYSPVRRINPLDACAHPYFNDLKRRETRLDDGKPLPDFFHFTDEELKICPQIIERLRPADYTADWNSPFASLSTSPGQIGNGGSCRNSSSFSPLQRTLSNSAGELKAKITSLARNSFRKNSLKRDERLEVTKTGTELSPGVLGSGGGSGFVFNDGTTRSRLFDGTNNLTGGGMEESGLAVRKLNYDGDMDQEVSRYSKFGSKSYEDEQQSSWKNNGRAQVQVEVEIGERIEKEKKKKKKTHEKDLAASNEEVNDILEEENLSYNLEITDSNEDLNQREGHKKSTSGKKVKKKKDETAMIDVEVDNYGTTSRKYEETTTAVENRKHNSTSSDKVETRTGRRSYDKTERMRRENDDNNFELVDRPTAVARGTKVSQTGRQATPSRNFETGNEIDQVTRKMVAMVHTEEMADVVGHVVVDGGGGRSGGKSGGGSKKKSKRMEK